MVKTKNFLKYLSRKDRSKLFLSNANEFPKYTEEYKDVKEIYIVGGNIISLPIDEISKYSELEVLVVSHNEIESVEGLEVKKVDLSYNKIKKASFGSNVIEIYLDHNDLEEFPEVRDCNKLEVICVNYNKIERLPNYLLNIKFLREIWVTKNPLDDMSYEIIKKLKEKGVKVR